MTDIGWAVASGALHLLVVGVIFGPLVWWRARRRRERAIGPGGWRTLALAGGIYLTAIIVLNLPRVGFFADLTFNWQNKLLLVLLLAVAVRGWPGLTWRGVGVRRPARRWWVPVLAIVLGALGLQLLGGPMAEVTPTVEAAAFQAVVPGLDEELLFRGVLLRPPGRYRPRAAARAADRLAAGQVAQPVAGRAGPQRLEPQRRRRRGRRRVTRRTRTRHGPQQGPDGRVRGLRPRNGRSSRGR